VPVNNMTYMFVYTGMGTGNDSISKDNRLLCGLRMRLYPSGVEKKIWWNLYVVPDYAECIANRSRVYVIFRERLCSDWNQAASML